MKESYVSVFRIFQIVTMEESIFMLWKRSFDEIHGAAIFDMHALLVASAARCRQILTKFEKINFIPSLLSFLKNWR